MSTWVAPVAASTLSTNAESCLAEFSMYPVPYTPIKPLPANEP